MLAGGRSTRMGFDKARAPWGSVPLAVAAARSLAAVCGRVAVIRRGDDGLPLRWPDETDVEVIDEPGGRDHHPLWGVATALRAARSARVAVIPCDVPGVTPESWAALAARAPAVAADAAGRVHPLVAVMERGALERVEALARAGAPAHHLADGWARVVLGADELTDRNEPTALTDPIAALLERIPVGDPAQRARIAAGEERRLRARGIIGGFALPPREGEGR